MSKVDTVGENYYKPLELAEKFGDLLFWAISVLSLVALFVEKSAYPLAADSVKITLIVCAILYFAQGQVQRMYLFPRAEDKRRQELLSNSFGVPLTHEKTVGYYNNDVHLDPLKRLGASVMESAFFTQEIARKMLARQRVVTVGYVALYLVAALFRSTDLEFLAVAAQALFGGEIISRWLRTEWLRSRSEQAFENFNRLFAGQPQFAQTVAQCQTVDLFAYYETTKCTAAILVSSQLFHKHNPGLTLEWEQIRTRLGL